MSRWTKEPSVAQEANAAAAGFLRNSYYMMNPESNQSYHEGAIWECWQHQIAALAEIMFADMLGVHGFLPSYNTRKGEPDVGEWEVRYGFSKDDGLPATHLRLVGTVDKLESPYVLLIGGSEKKLKRSAANEYKAIPMTAVGWIWGKDAAVDRYYIGTNQKGKNIYMVPVEDLRSMSELE